MGHRNGEDGFTMVELLMVLTIVGILLAIAVPTFLGTRRGANDRAAQTVVRNLLVSARSANISGGVSGGAIQTDEPTLHVVAPNEEGMANENEVSVRVGETGGASYVVLASRSTSGACFAILEPELGSTQYQRVAAGPCTADLFDPSTGWSDEWD
jgi:type IV pilus assembly protein PilA